LLFKGLCATFPLLWAAGLWAAETSEEEQLALVYGDKSFVSIATGVRQPVARAPAVATVITAQDIAALGATDLNEALEAVPGLHVSRLLTYAGKPIFIIRGIYSAFNPQVLVLVDGVPLTSVFLGDRGDVWGGMPLDNVERIEVMRGPGSALYGADAFAGVVNVITKTAADIDGTQAGVRTGSFRARDAWLLHGGKWAGMDVAAYLRYGRNEEHSRAVDADAQSGLDPVYGTHASLAPAPLRMGYEGVDAQLTLSAGHWRGQAGYTRRHVQINGLAWALGGGAGTMERFTADLGYEARDLAQAWDLSLRASYLGYDKQASVELYPPGAFGGAFPEGMIGTPGHWERNTRLSASALYKGLLHHQLRIGLGVERPEIYKTTETKNFNFVYVPGVGNLPVPLGGMVDVSDTAPYLAPHKRQVRYAYLQDEWQLAPDWTLTAGVRHDRYSDFGGTTNPRAALVWSAAYNVTAKLLYGRAFRAPSFTELYNINNPVALGNPAVRPETIASLEAALAWQPTPALQAGLSLFRHRMRDILRLVPNADPTTGATAQNNGSQTGRGFELEMAWEAGPRWRLAGNYAFQRSTDDATRHDAGMAPHHHLNLRLDHRLAPSWILGAEFNRVAGRMREPGDTRPPIANYLTTDLNLRSTAIPGWELRAIVRNVLDADAREPSPAPGLIPHDLPLPRRTWILQASHDL
jgi:iron complex outermembrane receptor protein